MIGEEIARLSKSFWNQVDGLIAMHLDTITLGDIAETYYGFCNEDQRELRGTKAGLDGFSEFLVVRAVIHYLVSCGFFSRNSARDIVHGRSRLTHVFKSERLMLSGGVAKLLGRKPDVLLMLDEAPWGVIEIKTWATNGLVEQAHFDRAALLYPCLRWALLAGGAAVPLLAGPAGGSAFCYRHLNGDCKDARLLEVLEWIVRPQELRKRLAEPQRQGPSSV